MKNVVDQSRAGFGIIAKLAVIIALAGCASHTHFVDRGMFNESPFVVGEGSTKQEATHNALASIPASHELEKNGTRASSCSVSGETPVWSALQQDYVCPSGRYQAQIAVLPKDKVEREQIETYRSAMHGKVKYIGVGNDDKLALKDLISKLPKNAVIDSYSIGCTKKINIDSKTGRTSCDNNPLGNKREATAFVIEPNVKKIISVE